MDLDIKKGELFQQYHIAFTVPFFGIPSHGGEEGAPIARFLSVVEIHDGIAAGEFCFFCQFLFDFDKI